MFFIGSFVHATNQEETHETDRRHGDFSLIVDAANPYAAIQKFKTQIIKYRETSEFFQGECSIFLIQFF